MATEREKTKKSASRRSALFCCRFCGACGASGRVRGAWAWRARRVRDVVRGRVTSWKYCNGFGNTQTWCRDRRPRRSILRFRTDQRRRCRGRCPQRPFVGFRTHSWRFCRARPWSCRFRIPHQPTTAGASPCPTVTPEVSSTSHDGPPRTPAPTRGWASSRKLSIDLVAADNGDGVINMKDVLMLRRYLARLD